MFAHLPPYLIRDVANYCYDEAKTSYRLGRDYVMAWWFGWLKYRGVRCRKFMTQGRELLTYATDDPFAPGQFRQLHEVFGFTQKDLRNESQIRALDYAVGSAYSEWPNTGETHPCYTDLDALKKYFDLSIFPHVDTIMREHARSWYPAHEKPDSDKWELTARHSKQLARAVRRETRNYWMARTVAS